MSNHQPQEICLRHMTPALILAPMEGVCDAPMRAVLAETGGFDFAVSEFIRVSQGALSAKTLSHRVPELGGKRLGHSTLPMQVQLLGSNPTLLAQTAIEACVAGAKAIDLNFGCPSPTVIRHQGGSALLKTPHLIQKITETVRKTLPSIVPLSVKIRLGWSQPDEVYTLSQAAYEGGAQWIVIHARTRNELYRPGVHWEAFQRIQQTIPIPIVANGDLFTLNHLNLCKVQTQCEHFMLGRGAMRDPYLANRIKSSWLQNNIQKPQLPLPQIPTSEAHGLFNAILRFTQIAESIAQNSGYVPNRIKQWLKYIQSIESHFECYQLTPVVSKPLISKVTHAKSTAQILDILTKHLLS